VKIEHTITIADAPYPVLRIFASWPAEAKLERTLVDPKKSKRGEAIKSRAEVDSVDVTDPDLHPLATLHLGNFNRIGGLLARSWYRNDTEPPVVFAEDRYDEKQV